MALQHYYGTGGTTIEPFASDEDMTEAVDHLHTLVLYWSESQANADEYQTLLNLLSQAIDETYRLRDLL